jgi:hypothetical protein
MLMRMGRDRLVVALAGLLCLLLVYCATYLVWSRCLAWRSGTLWCFYPPPKGLTSVNLTVLYYSPRMSPEEVWERQESLPRMFFRPCIVVDELLTGRMYLPTYEGAISWN